MQKLACLTILAAALAAPALAGPDEGKACRAGLAPAGQQMFDAVAPHVKADSKLDDLMRKQVRGLVVSGKLARSDAQANARPVGECLKQIKAGSTGN